MKLSLVERETILLYNQAEPMAEVYTHDPRLMEKLELLAKNTPTRSPERTPITLPFPSGVYPSGSHTAPNAAKTSRERAEPAQYQPPVRKSSS